MMKIELGGVCGSPLIVQRVGGVGVFSYVSVWCFA